MMSRHAAPRKNYNEPGHAHELTFCCHRRYQFLKSERTCNWLADSINEARESLHFDVWGYVFMPEHVHLIVHPREDEYDIAQIRAMIKEPVGREAIQYLKKNKPEWLPRITVKRGKRIRHYFWQTGGGYDRNVIEPATLLTMIEYIHNNPVRRGLVKRATDWKWSSARWYDGNREMPIRIDPI